MINTYASEKHVEWLELPTMPGVSGKLLGVDRQTKAHAYLVRYKPGTVFPRHGHPCLEHVYIVEGAVTVDGREHGAGTHFVYPAGQEHGPYENAGKLTELVFFSGMSGLETMEPVIAELFRKEGLL